MRTDFGLYIAAVICFIIAALPYTNVISVDLLKLDYPVNLTLTVIFAALGLILIILGYSQRPKPIISIPEAPKPTLTPPQPAQMSQEKTPNASISAPAPPTPPQEEIAKPESKKTTTKTRRKRTRRRRKKT